MTDAIASALVLAGGFFAVLGGLGLARLPDVLMRMHASTKIGTLACGMIVAAAAVHFGEASITVRAVAIVVFLLLTAPVAAHMIGRATVTTGVPLWRTKVPGDTEKEDG